MTPEMEAAVEEGLKQVILRLTKHFGRKPTEQEVVSFVFGPIAMREFIYANKGLPNNSPQSFHDRDS